MINQRIEMKLAQTREENGEDWFEIQFAKD